MNTTTFNGFEIEFRSNGVTIDSGRYYVKGDGFKAEGYANMSAAKGAITKAVNASQPKHNAGNEVLLDVNASRAATSDDKERASVPLISDESEARIEGMTQALREGDKIGWTTMRNDKDMPIHGDPQMAKMYAEMDYYGMSRTRDTRSRNKREGNHARRFKWQTKHMTAAVKNRKQEKANKLARKAAA